MMVDSLNDSSDYLFLDSTFIIFTLNSLSRVNKGERDQGSRIKRSDYDEDGLKGGVFRSDNVPEEAVVKVVDCFHGKSIGTKN
ncbi:hypothetical protein H5410_015513 [Solanum commersonii]|uniref:Uncharacterized protein n=1 Tax=Solanum commersonii TaxID=4109 RepID=A0A9J5ZTZ1_SOLCO|nr:hypothetical protein H5410_015513 [Solanum commersonii]